MYGDIGHGGLLAIAGIFLIATESNAYRRYVRDRTRSVRYLQGLDKIPYSVIQSPYLSYLILFCPPILSNTTLFYHIRSFCNLLHPVLPYPVLSYPF